MFKTLRADIDAVLDRDPAARSAIEVFLAYPGVHAVLYYRIAHWCWQNDLKLLGRLISVWARFTTGIEIHPGATIGQRFFIDHGMGVVIGETAEIGDDVTLYQGVTLGGTTLNQGKRHPTLKNNVIVGAGAKVLGPITLHDNARVGSNSVVLRDVPMCATVVGSPARIVGDATVAGFTAYGTPCDKLPDPVAKLVDELQAEIDHLSARLAKVEKRELDVAGKDPIEMIEEEPDPSDLADDLSGDEKLALRLVKPEARVLELSPHKPGRSRKKSAVA